MVSQSLYEIILSPEVSVSMPVETSCFQTRPPAEGLIWTDPMNICHRGKSRQGVQLEISRKIRDVLRTDKNRLQVFADAVRKGIRIYLKQWTIEKSNI
jgi:phage replication-related protein YjqB (UPF0714/DUF867 family)